MYKSNNDLQLLKNPRIRIMTKIVNNLNLENKKILDIGYHDSSFLSLISNKNEFYGIEASDYGVNESKKPSVPI